MTAVDPASAGTWIASVDRDGRDCRDDCDNHDNRDNMERTAWKP